MLKAVFFDFDGVIISNNALIPEMRGLVIDLAKEKALFIISAASTRFINEILKKAEIQSSFKEVYGVESGMTKAEKMQEILKLYTLGKETCVFVTDTADDVQEGAIAKVKTIAVSWGYHNAKKLAAANPECVVNTPRDLAEAIARISTTVLY